LRIRCSLQSKRLLHNMAASTQGSASAQNFAGDDVHKLNPDLEGGAYKMVFDREVPIEMRLQVSDGWGKFRHGQLGSKQGSAQNRDRLHPKRITMDIHWVPKCTSGYVLVFFAFVAARPVRATGPTATQPIPVLPLLSSNGHA